MRGGAASIERGVWSRGAMRVAEGGGDAGGGRAAIQSVIFFGVVTHPSPLPFRLQVVRERARTPVFFGW